MSPMLSKHSSHDRIFVSIRVAGALYEPELFAMCDYSLHGVATRPAKVGDQAGHDAILEYDHTRIFRDG